MLVAVHLGREAHASVEDEALEEADQTDEVRDGQGQAAAQLLVGQDQQLVLLCVDRVLDPISYVSRSVLPLVSP